MTQALYAHMNNKTIKKNAIMKKKIFHQQLVEYMDAEVADMSQAPGAHTCNPSYLGGRDQEDHSLKPTQANGSQDPWKKPITKRADGVAQVVRTIA
jgi:hypothetical protein